MAFDAEQSKILIVEDDPLLATTLRRHAAKIVPKATIHAVESAADAEESWAAINPDLVFMDYRLPDGTGIDVIQNMRKQQQNTCVICMTAETEKIPEEQIRKLQITAVYKKPVSQEILRSILTEQTSYAPSISTQPKHKLRIGRFRIVSWRGTMSAKRLRRLAHATRNQKKAWIVLSLSCTPKDEDARQALFAFSSWLSANGGRLCLLAENTDSMQKLKYAMGMFIDIFDSMESVKADQLRLTGFAERKLLLQALHDHPVKQER